MIFWDIIFRQARGCTGIFFYFLIFRSILVILTVSNMQIKCNPCFLYKLGLKVYTASKSDRCIDNGSSFNWQNFGNQICFEKNLNTCFYQLTEQNIKVGGNFEEITLKICKVSLFLKKKWLLSLYTCLQWFIQYTCLGTQNKCPKSFKYSTQKGSIVHIRIFKL